MEEGIVLSKGLPMRKKVMHAIFFTPKGLAIQVFIPKGTSMNAIFYRKKVLRKLVKFYQKCRPKIGICGIYLLHDNALNLVTPFLKEKAIYVLEQSPYSPDLAPCNFFSSLISRKILLTEIYLPPKVRCLHI